ncbi:hypothetical protein BH09BAC4_BH09BAC4_01480 [soil metagenome]
MATIHRNYPSFIAKNKNPLGLSDWNIQVAK